jgi:hypothetical protein
MIWPAYEIGGVKVTRSPALAGGDVSPSVWPCVCWPRLSCSLWRSSAPVAPIWMRLAHFLAGVLISGYDRLTAPFPFSDRDHRSPLSRIPRTATPPLGEHLDRGAHPHPQVRFGRRQRGQHPGAAVAGRSLMIRHMLTARCA